MLAWSLLFLGTALAFYVSSFGRITGHPVGDAKFMAAIFMALFLVSLVCIAISVKLVCPVPDAWLDLQCLHSSLKDII